MKKAIFALLLLLLQFSLLEGTCGSVVCIHGFMRTWRSMQPMGEELKSCGIPTYLWDYPSRDKTIREHACCLNELLKYIAEKKPGEPINFVTHSLGALILRATLNFPDCPEEAKVGRAVLLAPPNKGSFVARDLSCNPLFRLFFGSKAGCELMTYTECDMIALGDYPETMDILVIAGNRGVHPFFRDYPNDGKIALFETYLNTPHFHSTVPARHSSIMSSRCTIEFCRQFILCNHPERPQEPDSSDEESDEASSEPKTAETGK